MNFRDVSIVDSKIDQPIPFVGYLTIVISVIVLSYQIFTFLYSGHVGLGNNIGGISYKLADSNIAILRFLAFPSQFLLPFLSIVNVILGYKLLKRKPTNIRLKLIGWFAVIIVAWLPVYFVWSLIVLGVFNILVG